MEENLKFYNSKNSVAVYSKMQGLMPAETAVFEEYAAFIAAASVLDIGIGGGRTTRYLAGRCKAYTGIDYSVAFVEHVKKNNPGLTVLNADARDLSAFGDNSFGFVNFSFNGIDYVTLEGREKILAEIYRVLAPGGVFFFSTHNRNHASFDEWPWRSKRIPTFVKLKTLVKLIPFISRKLHNQKLEIVKPEYAIINDPAHNYSLMTFYTGVIFLKEQLAKAGFADVSLLSKAGKKTADELLDDWIFVTAKKTGA